MDRTNLLACLLLLTLPGQARAQTNQPVDPALPLDHIILTLQPSPAQQSALDTLTIQLQDPASPHFHKFLTPAQFAATFGASQSDLDKVSAWLMANGFHIDESVPNHLAIVFSGTAAQVQSAFHTEIRQYASNGETHYASTAPIHPIIEGIVNFNGVHIRPPFQRRTRRRPLFGSGRHRHHL